MKKIFLLMLIMGVFSPLVNAYEYLFYVDKIQDYPNNPSIEIKYSFFTNENGELLLKKKNQNYNDVITYSNLTYQDFIYSRIHANVSNFRYYDIKDYYLNDNLFLNDLYLQYTNMFLNYLYNNNNFNSSNYIKYENYELLYNSDGLVVESIVNGVWAGLYDDSEKGVSGSLYSQNGTLLYYNGEPVSWIQSTLDSFINIFKDRMMEIIQLLHNPVLCVIAVLFVFAMLYSIVKMAINAIKPYRYNQKLGE